MGNVFEQAGLRGVARNDLLAGNERLEIKDEVHAPFNCPILAMAAIAVGFKDFVGLFGEDVLVSVSGIREWRHRNDFCFEQERLVLRHSQIHK